MLSAPSVHAPPTSPPAPLQPPRPSESSEKAVLYGPLPCQTTFKDRGNVPRRHPRAMCFQLFSNFFSNFFFQIFFFFGPVRVELLTSPPLPFVAPARCRRHQWKATDRARITNEYLMTFYDPICAPSGIRYISQQRLASSVSIYFPLYIFFHFFTRSAVVRVLISPDLQPIRPFTREVRWRFCFTTSAPVGALWLPPFPRGLFIHWAVARSRGSYSIG